MASTHRQKDVRLLLIAATVSAMGQLAGSVAVLTLGLKLSGTGVSIGWILFCRILPTVALGPLAGMLADRFCRRRLMIVADIVRGTMFLLYPLVPSIAWLSVLTITETGSGFVHACCRTALLPALVDGRNELVRANSLLKTGFSTAVVIAPTLFSLLMVKHGLIPAIFGNSTTFFASAAIMALVSVHSIRSREPESAPSFGACLAGLQRLISVPRLLLLVTVCGLAAAGYAALQVAFPLLASREFSHTPGAHGFILSAIGCGLVLGSLAAPSVTARLPLMTALFGSLLFSGIMQMLFSISPVLSSALAFICLCGVSDGVQQVLSTTVLQSEVEDGIRARVFAAFEAATSLPVLAALLTSGWLVDRWGVRTLILGAGALVAIMAVLGLVCNRRMDAGRGTAAQRIRSRTPSG